MELIEIDLWRKADFGYAILFAYARLLYSRIGGFYDRMFERHPTTVTVAFQTSTGGYTSYLHLDKLYSFAEYVPALAGHIISRRMPTNLLGLLKRF